MIELIKEKKISVLKLNRPEKRNAINPELVRSFLEKLEEVDNDKESRVLVITGNGSSFCAGADLSFLAQHGEMPAVASEEVSEIFAELFLKLYHFPKPTIAAVNGPALGGGAGIASCCDFVIADSRNAMFSYSEVKIGFIPAIVSIFLVKRIGEQKAKQLFLTAETLNAQQAHAAGLADYLAEDILKEAGSLAEKLIANSAFSISLTKKMLQTVSTLSVDEAVAHCLSLNTITRSSEDFKTRLQKFLNKK